MKKPKIPRKCIQISHIGKNRLGSFLLLWNHWSKPGAKQKRSTVFTFNYHWFFFLKFYFGDKCFIVSITFVVIFVCCLFIFLYFGGFIKMQAESSSVHKSKYDNDYLMSCLNLIVQINEMLKAVELL